MAQKITTFLWFDGNALEAAKFYVSIFKNSKITSSNPMSVTFKLAGQNFYALNGGPRFKFTEAISLFIDCKDQKEVDTLWKKLLAGGGQESMCGWLKDRYGLSWQVIPAGLGKLISQKNPAKRQAAMNAMLQMRKINIAQIQAASDAA